MERNDKLQRALGQFNVGIHQWWGWKDLEKAQTYDNVEVLNETATMPTEEEVNAKIAELQVIEDRKEGYGDIGDQLDLLYKDIVANKLDTTGEWAKKIKAVKDANPKE